MLDFECITPNYEGHFIGFHLNVQGLKFDAKSSTAPLLGLNLPPRLGRHVSWSNVSQSGAPQSIVTLQ